MDEFLQLLFDSVELKFRTADDSGTIDKCHGVISDRIESYRPFKVSASGA